MTIPSEQQAIAKIATLIKRNTELGGDLNALRARPELARVRVTAQRNALLFNYTDAANYGPHEDWTAIERISRGLVFARDGALLALPFPKFFNWGELTAEEQEDCLNSGVEDVSDKVDGSLGIAWHDGRQWRVCTRGAFDSPQAKWAEEYLQQDRDGVTIAEGMSALGKDWTWLFEIVHPDNRVVLDYGKEPGKLVLLAIRKNDDGLDFPRLAVTFYGMIIGIEVAGFMGTPEGARDTVDFLTLMAEDVTGIEGWVVRFRNGQRAKFKTAEYRALHKIITSFSPARVLDMLIADAFPIYKAGLPPHLIAEAERIAAMITDTAAQLAAVIAEQHEAIMSNIPPDAPRKTFALAVQTMATEAYRPIHFRLYDGGDPSTLILKLIRTDKIFADWRPGPFTTWRPEDE